MKVLKIILYVISGIIVLFLVAALFFPSEYRIEQSMAINAPDSLIWAQISDFENRENWDPWNSMDPSATQEISDPSSGVGAEYSWNGEVIGTGKITYLEMEENRYIKSKLVFFTPQSGEADVTWRLEPGSDGITVTWSVEGGLSYPIERYLAGMIEDQISASFVEGLNKLKTVCE